MFFRKEHWQSVANSVEHIVRPFLNTAEEKILGVEGFKNFQDQVGSFLGGLDDYFEGRHNSLSFTGRQAIAERWRPEMVKIGNHMISGKPADIRAILESDIVQRIDEEELSKFFRLAIETAKIDNYLKKKPIAVIIKGNPDRMSETTKKLADKFYMSMKKRLELQGFDVEFDDGLEYTVPREDAAVWLGFSRGAGRLQFAPSGVKTYEIRSRNFDRKYDKDLETNRNLSANDPLHYQLHEEDIKFINSLEATRYSLDNYKTALALEQDA